MFCFEGCGNFSFLIIDFCKSVEVGLSEWILMFLGLGFACIIERGEKSKLFSLQRCCLCFCSFLFFNFFSFSLFLSSIM